MIVFIYELMSHLKFSFKSNGLRSRKEKTSKHFPCGVFLRCVVDKMIIGVLSLQETSPALKNSWLRTCIIRRPFYVRMLLTRHNLHIAKYKKTYKGELKKKCLFCAITKGVRILNIYYTRIIAKTCLQVKHCLHIFFCSTSYNKHVYSKKLRSRRCLKLCFFLSCRDGSLGRIKNHQKRKSK